MVIKYGKVSAYSVFMMLGGMILPYFYGLLYLDETVSIARIAGLFVLVFALPCAALDYRKGDKFNTKTIFASKPGFYYVLCVLIFILNGCTSIISKAHSINTTAVPAANFIFYVNLLQMIINGTVYFIYKTIRREPGKQGNTESKSQNKKFAVLTIILYAIISGTGYLFMLIPAKTVPAVMLYPFVTGGSIILSTLSAKMFFKEKISRLALIGIILSFAGTLLFLIN